MKTNKVIQLVCAASLAALVGVGCSSTNSGRMTSNTGDRFDVGQIDQGAISGAPLNEIKRRPDTHPELRSGLWSFYVDDFQQSRRAPVIETTLASTATAPDTTSLLTYNMEVRNFVAMNESSPVITEAAGASSATERESLEQYRRDLEQRVRTESGTK